MATDPISNKQESSPLTITSRDLTDQNRLGISVSTTSGQQVQLDFIDPTQYKLNRNLSILAGQIAQANTAISALQSSSSSSSTTTTTAPVTINTHANRLSSYPASKFEVGDIFYESDTQVFLLCELIGAVGSAVNTWVPAWASPILDTRANRVLYNSFFYPPGQMYNEFDTDLIYTARDSTTYSVAITGGTTVTAADNIFESYMVQYVVNIGGALYQVANYTSPTVITLASPAPNGSALVIIPANTWQYSSGVWAAPWVFRPPATGTGAITANDLGMSYLITDRHFTEQVQAGSGDSVVWAYLEGTGQGTLATMLSLGGDLTASEDGVLFYETDYGHTHRWNGTSSAWEFGEGDSSGYVVIGPSSPNGSVTTQGTNGWQPCDGGTYNVMTGDGTPVSFVTPNLNSTAAALYAGGWNATVNPAVNPSLSGGTDDESSHTHSVTTTSTETATGVTSGASLSAAQTVTSGPGSAHYHGLSEVTVSPGNPAYFSLSFWLRI